MRASTDEECRYVLFAGGILKCIICSSIFIKLISLLGFAFGITWTSDPRTKSLGLVFIFGGLACITFSSLLIYGVVKKMKNYMLLMPIIFRFITLVMYIIGMGMGIYAVETILNFMNLNDLSVDAHNARTLRVSLLIMLVYIITLGTYFSLIPLSYYNELNSERKEPKIAFENINSCSLYANTTSSKDIP